MNPSTLIWPLMITALVTLASPLSAQQGAPEFTPDGLQLIDDTNLALVYMEPGADLGRYDKIFLEAPYVAFKKNWQRKQNANRPGTRISTEDMEKIKTELAALFTNIFSATLSEGGYQLVNTSGEDVLQIRPAIINLDIVAPDNDAPGNTRSYAETAGEMTLYMELCDSLSGDLLARALDRQRDRQTGYFKWHNKVVNRAAANRILRVWADVLKEGLDDAGVTRAGGH